MKSNSRILFAFALLFFSINLALAATKEGGLGGYEPIKDINDPHVKFIAEFAVNEYNMQQKANLVLVKVLSGQKQIVAGTNYKLVIQTKVKGGGILQNYETVVFEGLPSTNPTLKLVSFNPLRKLDQSTAIKRPGGYTPIENPNDDPHVKFIAEFAVYEYNAQQGGKLELVKILNGFQQIVAGTNYKLLLQTKVKDGGILLNYETVVFAGLPTVNPILQLVSFKNVH